ncbi:hypothetical protein E4U92_07710 [Streptomyces galbus]|uniref:Uncharacterized protein n=1 Tax=Streptomyces galbus TaxID=33898 RepID=A0A4U5X9B7_STRGB|nr:hypothetical protein E4U92_07710 [Streptomyces galbus]
MAPPPMSGYSAPPGRPGHVAYGTGYVPYSRSTDIGHRTETDGHRTSGILRSRATVRRRAPVARGTTGGAGIRARAGGRKRRGHHNRPRRE